MAFIPSRMVLPYSGGTFTLIYNDTTGVAAINWSISKYDVNDNDFSVTITSSSTTSCTMTVTASPNTGTVNAVHSFYVQKVGAGTSVYRFLYGFNVEYDTANLMKPIWMDTYYIDSVNSTLQYTITADNEVVYSGKSIALPNTNEIIFNVNQLCGNYLNSHLPNGIADGYYLIDDYAKLFQVVGKNDSVAGEKVIAQYRFYNSYLYEDDNSVFLNRPIKIKYNERGMPMTVVDKRQYSFCSIYNKTPNETTVRYYKLGGTTVNEQAIIDNNAQSVFIERNAYNGVGGTSQLVFTANGEQYTIKVEDTCYDYCIYYCNALGGWDSLLVGGNTIKNDKIASKYYKKDFNNTTTEFEKTKFMNIITPTYRIYTDWFNDDEQSRLFHLLESTEVYLHNLLTDKIEPVIITNSNCEYKTYTNNGKQKWYNTIDLEVAQEKLRK